jgi:hypothetical protein
MAIVTNEKPVVQMTAFAIVLYPGKTGYAVQHTYSINLNGDTHLLKATLSNILEQRFPHLIKICYVTEKEYRKALDEGVYEGCEIKEKNPVVFPGTVLCN